MGKYITTQVILDRFEISQMTLHRWQKKANGSRPKFPLPKIKSSPNRYLASEIDEWEASL